MVPTILILSTSPFSTSPTKVTTKEYNYPQLNTLNLSYINYIRHTLQTLSFQKLKYYLYHKNYLPPYKNPKPIKLTSFVYYPVPMKKTIFTPFIKFNKLQLHQPYNNDKPSFT